MKPRKVVVTDYIEPDLNWERQEMSQRGVEFLAHQLKFAPNSEVIAATRDADVVVVNMVPITPETISGWERCKLVIRHGVGYDNVDVAALEKAGIPLCYIPDYCAEEVAEQAIALLMALRLLAGRQPARTRYFVCAGRLGFQRNGAYFPHGGPELGHHRLRPHRLSRLSKVERASGSNS